MFKFQFRFFNYIYLLKYHCHFSKCNVYKNRHDSDGPSTIKKKKKDTGLGPTTLFKKRFRHRCFLENFTFFKGFIERRL